MGQCCIDLGGGGLDHGADGVAVVGRVQDVAGFAGLGTVGQQWDGLIAGFGAGEQGCGEGGQALFVGQVESCGVLSLAVEQVAGQGDLRVGGSDRLDRLGDGDRVGDQLVDRDVGVGDLVDEGRVGAV